METEFKFRIDDSSLVDKILGDSMLDDYVDRNTLEEISMKAIYFDTDNLDLRKAGLKPGFIREKSSIWLSTTSDSLLNRTSTHSSQAMRMTYLSRPQARRSCTK